MRSRGKGYMYGFEGGDFADAVVGWDVVYCHATSLDKPEVGVLLNTFECAILSTEVEGCGPVVASDVLVFLFCKIDVDIATTIQVLLFHR
jgi:hypothetical protein